MRIGCWSATISVSAAAAKAISRSCAPRRAGSASKRCARSTSTASAHRQHGGARGAGGGRSGARRGAARPQLRHHGRVAHGDKLGRNLGFPTANIALRRAPPVTGIFAVRVHGLAAVRAPVSPASACGPRSRRTASRSSKCSSSISTRRSTAGGSRVEFLHKLRDEERYRRPRRADAADRPGRGASARGYFAAHG